MGSLQGVLESISALNASAKASAQQRFRQEKRRLEQEINGHHSYFALQQNHVVKDFEGRKILLQQHMDSLSSQIRGLKEKLATEIREHRDSLNTLHLGEAELINPLQRQIREETDRFEAHIQELDQKSTKLIDIARSMVCTHIANCVFCTPHTHPGSPLSAALAVIHAETFF